MLFKERIKQLRENNQIPQRVLAAALEVDTATYCKIEKGERKARREQVLVIAKLLKTDKNELLSLWLAEQVYSVVKDEKHIDMVLGIVKENIKK
jgi:transcriptional regulator with XRE-family HTH domain